MVLAMSEGDEEENQQSPLEFHVGKGDAQLGE